jgi:phage/plasmid-like protein (TIGR03299 family)
MEYLETPPVEVEANDTLLNLTLEVLTKFGISWETQKLKLVSENGLETKNYGLFRSDNGLWLGTHSEQYNVLQNYDLVKNVVYAAQSVNDLDLERISGGMFGEGRKVYIQIPLPNQNVGEAELTRNLTALNSHDGSTSVAFGTTQTNISCQNTFYQAYKSKDITRIKHHSNMASKIQEVVTSLEQTIRLDQQSLDRFRRMLEIEFDNIDIENLKKSIFNVQLTEDEEEKLTTRKQNIIKSFDECVEIELAKEGTNAWGLFNAVTRYTNHKITTRKRGNIERTSLENVMVGAGARINNLAYSYLVDKYEL